MPINREDCWGISWNCGMKCAVIRAHREAIFLPHGQERREGEEGNWINENVKLFNQCRCCTGTNAPCPFASLFVARSSQRQGRSNTSAACASLVSSAGQDFPLPPGHGLDLDSGKSLCFGDQDPGDAGELLQWSIAVTKGKSAEFLWSQKITRLSCQVWMPRSHQGKDCMWWRRKDWFQVVSLTFGRRSLKKKLPQNVCILKKTTSIIALPGITSRRWMHLKERKLFI